MVAAVATFGLKEEVIIRRITCNRHKRTPWYPVDAFAYVATRSGWRAAAAAHVTRI